MNNTELTSISEEELFFDIHQNNSLTTNKLLLEKTQTNNDSGYYMSIVDSIDYLGCINGNCSKIECKCKPNEKCNCSNLSKTNLESNSSNSSNSSNVEKSKIKINKLDTCTKNVVKDIDINTTKISNAKIRIHKLDSTKEMCLIDDE